MFQLAQVADRDAKLVANQQRICMATRPTLTDYASVSVKLGTHIPYRSLSCHVIGLSTRSFSHMQIHTSPILLVSQVFSYCNPSLLLSEPNGHHRQDESRPYCRLSTSLFPVSDNSSALLSLLLHPAMGKTLVYQVLCIVSDYTLCLGVQRLNKR